jgi:FKBP-type peptidyl-prolyl cis-trans isomerase
MIIGTLLPVVCDAEVGDLADTNKPTDVQVSASGLASAVLVQGTGANKPGIDDNVKVHYSGWTADGRLFDSSENSGTAPTVAVNGVISGWTEALQGMVEGEKRRIWIPGNLAFGKSGKPGRPAGDLIYDLQLLRIEPAFQLPKAPENLTTPPSGAVLETNGIKWVKLENGRGNRHLVDVSQIGLHFTIWHANGEIAATTRHSNQARSYKIEELPLSLREIVKSMHEGESRRLWLPENPTPPGPTRLILPKGKAVMDILLESIAEIPEK